MKEEEAGELRGTQAGTEAAGVVCQLGARQRDGEVGRGAGATAEAGRRRGTCGGGDAGGPCRLVWRQCRSWPPSGWGWEAKVKGRRVARGETAGAVEPSLPAARPGHS